MNMVAKKPENATVPAMSEAGAVLSMVAKAASDPNVDIDKLERLMQMRERALEREAKAEFSSALTDLQAELPSINERGKVEGRYTFARWEDINTIIKPILQKHGFSLSFRSDTTDGVRVTGVLSHRNGRSESTTVAFPADPSGGKNAVQAVQSSVSYGKRSTATSLLNLTSYGEDDDGFNGARAPQNPWVEIAEKLTEFPEYLKQREALLKEFKTANKVPTAVQRAFADAKARTEPKD